MKKPHNFETLIDSFINTKVGIDNEFISNELCDNLLDNLLELFQTKAMQNAGTGNTDNYGMDTLARVNAIYWLDKSHQNIHETEFLNHIEDFIKYLNITCYAGIVDYEFHYSLFEKNGFYAKHLDRFSNNSNRKYSMVNYLNKYWESADCGELKIYNNDESYLISPIAKKMVLFDSATVYHEVLPTQKNRMSITGWLKTDS